MFPAAEHSSGRASTAGTSATRETLDTQLNVFAALLAQALRADSRASDVLFLANIQPGLQLEVRAQCAAARFVALDSMNLWIDFARDELLEIISRVDCLILNDEELRQLTGKPNLVSAAREILSTGPSIVVAKQGEHGAALITADQFFALPAYPLETVIDPTGAGDTFAGGFVGLRRCAISTPASDDRRAAQCDGLRHRPGLVQRRGLRDRAGHPCRARTRWRSESPTCGSSPTSNTSWSSWSGVVTGRPGLHRGVACRRPAVH